MKTFRCEDCGKKVPVDPSGMCPECTPWDILRAARHEAKVKFQVEKYGKELSAEDIFKMEGIL